MADIQKHQTLKGKNAGKWVTCTAEQKCRNGGIHTTIADLNNARELYEQKTGIKVTVEEVPLSALQDYNTSSQQKNYDDNNNGEEFDSQKFRSVAKAFWMKDSAQVAHSGILYPNDAEHLENIFNRVETQILNNPLPQKLALPENVIEGIKEDLHQIRGLKENQRRTVLKMIDAAAAGCYLTVHRRDYPNSNMGINVNQLAAADVTLAWLKNLRGHLKNGSDKQTLTTAFEVIEQYYESRI